MELNKIYIVISTRSGTKQKMYSSIPSYIRAKDNDVICPFNKATFSTDFCTHLIYMYAKENAVIYDPFMGSGTTAVACLMNGRSFIGSEISENQVRFAEERIEGYLKVIKRSKRK